LAQGSDFEDEGKQGVFAWVAIRVSDSQGLCFGLVVLLSGFT
jgi:hypothetical protein